MLPPELANSTLSLVPGKDRRTLSLVFVLDKEGNMLKVPEVTRTVICSCAKLSYLQAQDIIAGRYSDQPEQVKVAIKDLHGITQAMRQRRLLNGELTTTFFTEYWVLAKICFTSSYSFQDV